MFTIEVKKRGKEEKFGFEDVQKTVSMFHDKCWDVKGVRSKAEAKWKKAEAGIKEDVDYLRWVFICKRCKKSISILVREKEDIENEIVQTAIDGKERKISKNIRVIQKT